MPSRISFSEIALPFLDDTSTGRYAHRTMHWTPNSLDSCRHCKRVLPLGCLSRLQPKLSHSGYRTLPHNLPLAPIVLGSHPPMLLMHSGLVSAR